MIKQLSLNLQYSNCRSTHVTPRSQHLYDGLRLHFGITYADGFIDGLTTLMLGYPVIDVIKLDKWLKQEHYNDYPRDPREGISMSNIIVKFYGKDADDWIAKHVS